MNNSSKRTKQMVLLAIFSAFMLIFGYIEKSIPLVPAVPGIRLGLSNIVLIYALVLIGFKPAAYLIFIKVSLGGILYLGPIGTMYTLAGSVLSLVGMYMVMRFKLFNIVGMSIIGSVAHMAGQLIVAYFNLGWLVVLANLPFLLIASAVSGAFIGILSIYLLRHISKIYTEYRDKLEELGV